MSRQIDHVTERLLSLPVGKSCVISRRALSRRALQKYAPESRWKAESLDGGLVVTRVC